MATTRTAKYFRRRLTPRLVGTLKHLQFIPRPRKSFDRSEADRLVRWGLVDVYDFESPCEEDGGATCPHLRLTDLGKEVVKL